MDVRLGLVVASGKIGNYEAHRAMLADLPELSAVYCADGGVRHASRLGISPDLILGDFDSADSAQLAEYQTAGIPFERYPTDKDYTDTELAVERAVRAGCGAILLFGALGARIDHTLANMQLLYKYALRGVRIALADGYGAASVLLPGSALRIDKYRPAASLLGYLTYAPAGPATPAAPAAPVFANPKLSILPVGGAAYGVTTSGLLYALIGAVLDAGYTSGVSNEFTGPEASVELTGGALYIMICDD